MIGNTQLHSTISLILLNDGAALCCLNLSSDSELIHTMGLYPTETSFDGKSANWRILLDLLDISLEVTATAVDLDSVLPRLGYDPISTWGRQFEEFLEREVR